MDGGPPRDGLNEMGTNTSLTTRTESRTVSCGRTMGAAEPGGYIAPDSKMG